MVIFGISKVKNIKWVFKQDYTICVDYKNIGYRILYILNFFLDYIISFVDFDIVIFTFQFFY